ncbi:MAG: EutN/CcmL family microcompartment protein [Vibrio sp.]
MQFAKVIGSAVSTQKHPDLIGKKLLLVQSTDPQGNMVDNRINVAVDCCGCGEGEWVLVTSGSSARMAINEPNTAIDLAIVAIVDTVSMHG